MVLRRYKPKLLIKRHKKKPQIGAFFKVLVMRII